MSFAILQAQSFCDINHYTFKVKYEKCYKEFSCAFYKIVENEIETDEQGALRMILEREDKVATVRDRDFEKAILGSLGAVNNFIKGIRINDFPQER